MTKNTLSMIARLSGQSNYDIWSIRIEAVLTEKGLLSTINPDNTVTEELDQKGLAMIRLSLDDGPLLQVRQCKTASETWTSLKNLYSPKGFSSEFLICKELFETDLESCNHSMENFLNTVKRLTDELKAKKIELPDQVILAWVLNNLTSDYDAFTTIITQSLRTDSTKINLENLFSSLIDEARRQKSKDGNSTALLVNSKKRKFSHKQDPKKRAKVVCSHCKKPGHRQEKCWILHPELKPKAPPTDTSANHVAENSDDDSLTEEAMHVNVFNTVNSQITDFLLDSACSKHIICDKSYFSSFTEKATMVNWGNASKIRSNGYGNVQIRFSDTNKEATLRGCLFVPEIGVNLISMATLDQKGFSSLFQNGKLVLKKGDAHITTGQSRNGLYYLPIFPLAESVFLSRQGSDSDYSKWHLRMGHLGSNSMSHLSKCTKGVSITAKRKADDLDPFFCEVCQKAKFTSTVNRKSKFQAEYFLHKVYADLCGPITPESLGGGRYILLVIDSFTKWAEITILSKKSHTFEAFVKIKARLEKNAKHKLAIFKSDNGTEFKNRKFTELFDSTGTVQQFTAPYAHSKTDK
jgi:hypothetical protein